MMLETLRIYIAGDSHLAHYTTVGAAYRGHDVVRSPNDAQLILIAEDMPTNAVGVRDVPYIERHVELCDTGKPVLLMSQVPPGFCRRMNRTNLYHYPETLRIRDSYDRACSPEYIIIGHHEWALGTHVLPKPIQTYCTAFKCPVFVVTYEEAEIAKIAVNTYLRHQVEASNELAALCKRHDAVWARVTNAIAHDKRIGPHAYLEPGRWQDSLHLLRDAVTLERSLRSTEVGRQASEVREPDLYDAEMRN